MNVNKNFIVSSPNLKDTDRKLFFGDEEIEEISPDLTMFHVLFKAGIFKSIGEARRNWSKTSEKIPPGFTHIQGIGKMKHEIAILNVI